MYDAFISYSHGKDRQIATALQRIIQRLGKRWYERRALRVFRDDTSLSATPHLWGSIQAALDQSRFLILLVSEESASSHWVNQEVQHWLKTKSIETLLLAVTSGELIWSDEKKGFLAAASVMPPALAGRFAVEPKWVDLRPYRLGASINDRALLELGADFSAHIRGMPKEDLLSEEVKQQSRALTLAWSAIVLLVVLVVGVAFAGVLAFRNERLAIEREREANRLLAAQQKAADDLLLQFTSEFGGKQGMPSAALVKIASAVADLFEDDRQIVGDRAELIHNHAKALIEFSKKIAVHDPLQAAEKAQKAIDLLRGLGPENPGRNQDLAAAYASLGTATLKSDFPQAAAAFAEELRVAESIARDDGDALPVALANHAIVQLARCNPQGARASHERILALWRERYQGDPAGQTASARKMLMDHLQGFARVLDESGNREDALAGLEEARQIGESLRDQIPDDLDAQDRLARVYGALSELLAEHKQLVQAIDYARREQTLARNLVTLDDFRDDWKFRLAAGLVREAELESNLRHPEIAATLFAEGRKILDALDRTAFAATIRHDYAVTLVQAAETERALARPEEALALYRKAVGLLVAIADPRWNNQLQKTNDELARLLLELNRASEAFAVMQEWVRFLETHFPDQTDRRARGLGALAWYAMLAHQPDEALAAAQQGEALRPGIWWVALNKAHALMLAGQDITARSAYLTLAESMRASETDISADVQSDFNKLQEHGLHSALMREIEPVFAAAAQGATHRPHVDVPLACAR